MEEIVESDDDAEEKARAALKKASEKPVDTQDDKDLVEPEVISSLEDGFGRV